ncbi:MAG TPA: hypothetical protein VIH54_18950, partial [Chthoniobacterales bacterium]
SGRGDKYDIDILSSKDLLNVLRDFCPRLDGNLADPAEIYIMNCCQIGFGVVRNICRVDRTDETRSDKSDV